MPGAEGGTQHGVTLIVAAVLGIFNREGDLALRQVISDNGAHVADDRLCGRVAISGGRAGRDIRADGMEDLPGLSVKIRTGQRTNVNGVVGQLNDGGGGGSRGDRDWGQ